MIHSFDFDVATRCLSRVRDRVFAVEQATRRKRTPGREKSVLDGDDLCCWDSMDADACNRLGIDIWKIGHQADELCSAWLAGWRPMSDA